MANKERILVVDDEINILMVLSELLTDRGYDVSTAKSGEEALVLFEEEPFLVVVTDVRMRKMNGFELTDAVKRISELVHVIIMTSHVSAESAINALNHGADEYIIKPFEDLNAVVATINNAVEKVNLKIQNQDLTNQIALHNEKLQEANKLLKEQAIKDGLTGIYNFRHFHSLLEHEISRSRRYKKIFSLIFFDIDYFKNYNDTNGHLDGDALLIELARQIKNNLRQSDLFARYGGEEFIVILPETDKSQAVTMAEKIRRLISSYPFEGRENQPGGCVTISGGVSTFIEDGGNSKVLINAADKALYKAKETGRNRIIHAGEIDPE